ncbi:MAG: tripartite tricarboxylate transporter TctB family protein [Proteobacteria bacterium]|nr:tripartite tricarboxylate transporter TctB family protein [Pseudomonadota bacterium]MBU2228090.1 tripartite tricarboxylate transporter TctB family protein [Pseudomonadota bacterium]MBU2261411.1 tripartite tricarboxylate transporter TctB family protein [Pseudomonadota bacterium]
MSSRWIDRGVAIFIIGVSIGLYVLAQDFPLGSDLFPKFTLITIIGLAALMFGQTFFAKTRALQSTEKEAQGWNTRRPYLVFGISLLYAALMYLIGYLAASVVTALLLMPALGVKKKVLYGLVTGGVILFIYLLFNRFLMVQLPIGRLLG